MRSVGLLSLGFVFLGACGSDQLELGEDPAPPPATTPGPAPETVAPPNPATTLEEKAAVLGRRVELLGPNPPIGVIRASFGTSSSDMWLVSDTSVIHSREDGRWEDRTPKTEKAPTTTFFTGWASSAKDGWVVAGTGARQVPDGRVYHFVDGTWTEETTFHDRVVHAIWGSGAKDVWALVEDGEIQHFDGTQWQVSRPADGVILRAIHGTSPSNVWAVGDSKRLLHFDGAAWKAPADWTVTVSAFPPRPNGYDEDIHYHGVFVSTATGTVHLAGGRLNQNRGGVPDGYGIASVFAELDPRAKTYALSLPDPPNPRWDRCTNRREQGSGYPLYDLWWQPWATADMAMKVIRSGPSIAAAGVGPNGSERVLAHPPYDCTWVRGSSRASWDVVEPTQFHESGVAVLAPILVTGRISVSVDPFGKTRLVPLGSAPQSISSLVARSDYGVVRQTFLGVGGSFNIDGAFAAQREKRFERWVEGTWSPFGSLDAMNGLAGQGSFLWSVDQQSHAAKVYDGVSWREITTVSRARAEADNEIEVDPSDGASAWMREYGDEGTTPSITRVSSAGVVTARFPAEKGIGEARYQDILRRSGGALFFAGLDLLMTADNYRLEHLRVRVGRWQNGSVDRRFQSEPFDPPASGYRPSPLAVNDLYASADGLTVWAATAGGLVRIGPEGSRQITTRPASAIAAGFDSATLVLAEESGLFLVDDTHAVPMFPLALNFRVRKLDRDRSGNLWAAGDDGITLRIAPPDPSKTQ